MKLQAERAAKKAEKERLAKEKAARQAKRLAARKQKAKQKAAMAAQKHVSDSRGRGTVPIPWTHS